MWKVGVNPCGRCVVVAPLPQIAKFPKNSQNNDFKIYELIWVGIFAPLSNEGNILSFGDDLSGGLIKTTNPNLILKLFPHKTTIDIIIIISYILELQRLKFDL